jgi:DNA helicase-2/ATP-dependent DNA helicase PcrA
MGGTHGTPPEAGDQVRHANFGEGMVVNCIPSGEDYEVTVAFTGGAGVKRLLLSYSHLEKLG